MGQSAVVGATASQAGIDATALTFGFLTCLAFVTAAFLVVAIASGDQPERLERVALSMSREGTHRDGLVDHSAITKYRNQLLGPMFPI
jgi:hypothetical protein